MQDFTKPFSIDIKPKQVRAEAIEQKVDMNTPNLTKQPQKTFWDMAARCARPAPGKIFLAAGHCLQRFAAPATAGPIVHNRSMAAFR